MELRNHRRLVKRLSWTSLFCLLLFCLAACGKETQREAEESAAEASASSEEVEIVIENETLPEETAEAQSPAAEEEEIPPSEGMVRSLFTNQWISKELAEQRPVAVMYPIDKKAQPQYGLSRVSVFYEILEEGSMSRQMGIIEDYSGLNRIGNIRSIRDYFIYEALEWDAVIVHFGGPEIFVKDMLTRKDVDNLNGVSGVMGSDYGAFYRVPANVTSTHNAYTDSEHLEKAIEKAGFQKTHREELWSTDRADHWKFARASEPVTLDAYPEACSASELSMKGIFPISCSSFTYHPEDGKYYRFLYGQPQKDALTGEQMAFDNILVESCVSGDRGKGYLYYHVLDGGHFGWFITRGKMIPVRWQKTKDYETTRFYDPVGNEIVLNEGKTMVCIAREGQDHFVADGVSYDL